MPRNKSNKKWYALGAVGVAAAVILMLFILGVFNAMGPWFPGPDVPSDPEGPEYTGYWLTMSMSPSNICVGDRTTGSLSSNMPNAICSVFTNVGSGWTFFGNAILDSNGRYSQSATINSIGTALFRATCADTNGNYRISNEVMLTVTDCDSDGDGHSNSEEIEAGTDPFDPDDYPGAGQGTLCSAVVIPTDVGDKGAYCDDYGTCSDSTNCAHYWDYANKIHRCGCTDSFFCGQYCYEYVEGVCRCPPGSSRVFTGLYDYMCVPDGYECIDGSPVEV